MLPTIVKALATGHVNQDVLDIIAASSVKARFLCKHVVSRDSTQKTIMDSYVSVNFDVGLREKEYIGHVQRIIHLDYDIMKQTLICRGWYNNYKSL